MNARKAGWLSGWFASRAVRMAVLGTTVVAFLAVVAVDAADAKGRRSRGARGRGGSSNYVNTPYGRMPKYRPQLQVPFQ